MYKEVHVSTCNALMLSKDGSPPVKGLKKPWGIAPMWAPTEVALAVGARTWGGGMSGKNKCISVHM